MQNDPYSNGTRGLHGLGVCSHPVGIHGFTSVQYRNPVGLGFKVVVNLQEWARSQTEAQQS